MNKELIKITTNEQGKKITSAKELYLGLGLNKSQWSRWYPTNIEKNEFFSENIDWIGVRHNVEGNETMDFAITLEFAKHLAMMSKSQKSHEYRNYFIECEKAIIDPVQNYLEMSEEDRAILYFTKAKEAKQLEADNKKKDELLLIAGERTTIVDEFLDSKGLYGIDTVAKTLAIKGMGRNNLYEYLRDNKIIMTDTYIDKHGKEKAGIKHYEAFSKYTNSQGYFEHRTRDTQMGYKTVKQNVAMFTPKGVEWIIKKLQKDGYIAKKDLKTVITELESKLVA